MSLRQTRNTIPEEVRWNQSAILKAITDIARRLGLPVNETTPAETDARAMTVRGVNDPTIINAIEDLQPILKNIEQQLRLITGDEDHANS